MKLQLQCYLIWQGLGPDGQQLSGRELGLALQKLRQQLAHQQITVSKLRLQILLLNTHIKPQLIIDLLRQLHSLYQSAIPITEALTIMHNHYSHRALQRLIKTMQHDLEHGSALSTSLKKHSQYFDHFICALITAGEQTGTLATSLNQAANYLEKSLNLKRRILKALCYPSLVCLTASVIITIFLTVIIPQFAKLFADFNAQLPAYTKLLITIANSIKNNLAFILTGFISLTILYKVLYPHCNSLKKFQAKLALKLPYFGSLLRQITLVRVCRTLAVALQNELPLTQAIKITTQLTNNYYLQQELKQLQTKLVAGQLISTNLNNSQLFTDRAKQLLAVGETSGNLIVMLENIANYYSQNIDHTISNLNNLFEPAIMIILGLVIGGLIIGMYLPIFRIGAIM